MIKTGSFSKIISLLLCVFTLAFSLSSCGKKDIIATYTADGKDYTVTEKEFDFFMKYRKYEYFYSSYISAKYDTADFWSTKIDDGNTIDKTLTDSVIRTAKTVAVEKYLMDKYGLTLDEADVKKAKEDSKTAEKNYGGAGAFKKYWGYTGDDYYEYQLSVLRSKKVYDYLFSDAGSLVLDDGQLEEYYKENYKQYQFILINTKQKIATDDEGNKQYLVYDESGNSVYVTDISKEFLEEKKYTLGYNYKYENLTDEEKEKKSTLAEELIAQLKNGAVFKELAVANSDNFYSSYYPNGLIVDGDLVNDDKVIEALKDLEIGSYTDAISVSSGDYIYIIKRVELKEKAYKDAEENAEDKEYAELFKDYIDTVKSSKYSNYLEELCASVVTNDAIINKYNMTKTYLSQAIRERDNYYN